jgi:hypothetical protein
LNVTVLPGFAASKSVPICVNAAVSEDAAKTVRSTDSGAEPEGSFVVVDEDDEQADRATNATTATRRVAFRIPPPSRGARS